MFVDIYSYSSLLSLSDRIFIRLHAQNTESIEWEEEEKR